MTSFFANRNRQVTSMTIEHGVIKLLACRGLEVLDYRVLLAEDFPIQDLIVNIGLILRDA